MSSIGIKIDQFNVPVCNSFQAKILNDQLCYEVDLNLFSYDIYKELKLGLNLLMDYNEDRLIVFDEFIGDVKDDINLAMSASEVDENKHATIYLNTVGRYTTS